MDVAELAGVSQSAVSRTFAKEPTQSGVSSKTRAKVLQAAKTLGYRPNALARSLITNRSRIVALLFSYLDNPFYALALEKFCRSLQEVGYHALVFMMPDTLANVEETVSDLIQYQVDGIITASVELSSDICQYCLDQDIPIVMFNRTQDDPRLSSVTTDNVAGGRTAARYLIEGGHQRTSMLAGWEGASTNRDREFGFLAELAAQNVKLYDRVVGHFDLKHTEKATLELFDRPSSQRPDAVFVLNDYMAVTAMGIIRGRLGLRIPDDVSIFGFDDIPAAALPEYQLTTIRQPVDQMVAAAIRLLLQSVENSKAEPEQVRLAGRFCERQSCKRP